MKRRTSAYKRTSCIICLLLVVVLGLYLKTLNGLTQVRDDFKKMETQLGGKSTERDALLDEFVNREASKQHINVLVYDPRDGELSTYFGIESVYNWQKPNEFQIPKTWFDFKHCNYVIRYHFVRSAIQWVDAVIWSINPNFFNPNHTQIRKKPGQIWIGWTQENRVVYPAMQDIMDHKEKFQMDYLMTHESQSEIPISFLSAYYMPAYSVADFFKPPPAPHTRIPRIGFMYNNCNTFSKRELYIRDLMHHFPSDSFGRCENNKISTDETPFTWGHSQHYAKVGLIERYYFTLAMENAITKDWVTEKVYQALLVGTIPIFMGGPKVEELLPCKHCIIKTSDFESPKELAKHLHQIVSNKTLHDQYLSWKMEAYHPAKWKGFQRAWENSKDTLHCRICNKVQPKLCSSACDEECRRNAFKRIPDLDTNDVKRSR